MSGELANDAPTQPTSQIRLNGLTAELSTNQRSVASLDRLQNQSNELVHVLATV